MIRSTTAVIAGLVLVGSILTVPSASWARKGGGSHSSKTEVQAELAPCCGNPEPSEPGATGKAKRKAVSKDGSPRTDHFSADIEIPIPSAGLNITDPTTADIRLMLSREGTNYAECFLVLDADELAEPEGDDDDGRAATAEFHVKIMSAVKKDGPPVVRQVKGECSVNLDTADVQLGVPAVQAGDVATVRVVDSATFTEFALGTFTAKH
jgi:hypothetical protein